MYSSWVLFLIDSNITGVKYTSRLIDRHFIDHSFPDYMRNSITNAARLKKLNTNAIKTQKPWRHLKYNNIRHDIQEKNIKMRRQRVVKYARIQSALLDCQSENTEIFCTPSSQGWKGWNYAAVGSLNIPGLGRLWYVVNTERKSPGLVV